MGGNFARTSPGLAIVALGVLNSCGKVTSTASDAQVIDTAVADAMPTCNPIGRFGTPTPLGGFATSGAEAIGRLSYDELTMIYTSTMGSTDRNLYMTTRSRRDEPFSAPSALSINSTSDDIDPTISRDGLLLVFASNRGGGGARPYAASRSALVGDFANPTPVTGLPR